jgi:hypothetical protein
MKEPHTILLRQFFVGDEVDVTAFKEAGDELVDFIVKGEKYRWYEDFLRPIGFLYRHYLELELKYWITELGKMDFEEQSKFPTGHSLKELWDKLKPLVQHFCISQGNKQILRDVERVIMIFHQYDPTGQEFRYNRTTKDTPTLRKLPERVDVRSLKSSIDTAHGFFNGLSGVVNV